MLEWTPDYQDDEEMASYRETWLKFARCAILAYRAAMRERGYVDCRIVKTADGRIEYKFDPPIELNADGGLFQPPPPTPSKPQS